MHCFPDFPERTAAEGEIFDNSDEREEANTKHRCSIVKFSKFSPRMNWLDCTASCRRYACYYNPGICYSELDKKILSVIESYSSLCRQGARRRAVFGWLYGEADGAVAARLRGKDYRRLLGG